MNTRLFATVLIGLSTTACVSAPAVVVVDRATALEREAAGTYPTLSQEIDHAGILARPVPLTRAQLEAAGQPRPVVDEPSLEPADPERTDALLRAGCLGEALDGTLVETKDHCAVKEVPHLGTLLTRTNRDRLQIWEWLRQERPHRSLDEVRKAWRSVHLRGVVCGGLIQRDDGGWEAKKC